MFRRSGHRFADKNMRQMKTTRPVREVAFGLPAGYLWLQVQSTARCPMSDELPDRLCNDPISPYYNAALLERGIGIRFNGKEKTNVEEYCVSEGWIRVTAGNAKDRHGNPLTIKLKGEVVPYLRDPPGPSP
jgi:hypothetical protein